MTLNNKNGQKRISRLTIIVLFATGLAFLFCTAQACANNDSICTFIQQAGNANSDQVRLDYLKQLRKQPVLDASFKSDLNNLITQITRWLTPPRDIAVLVTESTTKKFNSELFIFGKRKRSMSAEFYLLDPGRYKLTIMFENNGRHESADTYEFSVKDQRTRVNFKLPSRKICKLYISHL